MISYTDKNKKKRPRLNRAQVNEQKDIDAFLEKYPKYREAIKRGVTASKELNEEQLKNILSVIFDRADVLANSTSGGNLPKGQEAKVPVSIRIDKAVEDWLRSKGDRHNARINGILRAVMELEQNQENDTEPS